jgi:tRNA pseudouridine13 synthase
LEWDVDGTVLTLSFSLPSGAYATSVLRELMKTDFQAAENVR